MLLVIMLLNLLGQKLMLMSIMLLMIFLVKFVKKDNTVNLNVHVLVGAIVEAVDFFVG